MVRVIKEDANSLMMLKSLDRVPSEIIPVCLRYCRKPFVEVQVLPDGQMFEPKSFL
jgi:hypothetical protein